MIEVTYDRDLLDKVKKRLGRMQEQAPRVIKNAVNQTARQARRELAEEAQKTYTVKKGGFYKAMRIRSASVGDLEAVISAAGSPLPLIDFRVSTAGGQVRVQVRKDRSLKPLEKDGIKAFVNNIAERGQVRRRDTRKGRKGSAVRHMAIAQREGSERLHIQEKFSNSIPVMIGNEDTVYGVVEPHIQEMLQTYIDKEIDKILGR